MDLSLNIAALSRAYADTALTPLAVIDEVYARLAGTAHEGVFIHEVPHAQAREAARAAMARRARGDAMRLYGLPFAVKDNIDIAGLPTTAACPAFAYVAERSAKVVERLIAEGAILIGKTNLDQFATGLVGVRSPYGIPENPFDRRYIPGGSSSGSAVCVARGFCAFALGTDTAGSGRLPAAFNNVVGLKPSSGVLSARGVVPACRSLDCVSVFALTVDDAAEVAHALAGFDAGDPFARRDAATWDPRAGLLPPRIRVAVPSSPQRPLDAESSPGFARALEAVERLGGAVEEADFAPFAQAGALLYDGPWVVERLEATGEILARDPDALHPAVREIMTSAGRHRALDVFQALHTLQSLRARADALFDRSDVLLVPSAPTIYRVDEVLADPIRLNARLGTYANFVNLLDLCALAVPAGRRADGLPLGVTLIARRGRDALLASIGRALQVELAHGLGATAHAVPPLPMRADGGIAPALRGDGERIALAVVGAHLSGEPLNAELTDLGARLLCATRTAARYRLFALSTTPPKPGLVRVRDDERGDAIELEVWELAAPALGRFMRRVAAPLCIGSVELADGARVHGFLCEPAATEGQHDISAFGGWRAYRRSVN